ncbi:MAG: sulfatase [Rubripirellula sp.]
MKRILFFWALVLSITSGAAVAAQRPNVLLISVDDLNDWIGCLDGHPQAHTPNIDRLASRGTLFANAHCASPACNPSRAIVFSGMMPWKTGVWSNRSQKLFQQHPDARVIPRAFGDAGYITLGTGKLMHSSGTANRVMFDHHFNPEQRWSPFTREQVRYTEDELPSKGTGNPRHLIDRAGRESVTLPLNRMPSDRKPDGKDGESFDWGPIDVPDSAMGDTQITDWAIERLRAGFDGKPFFLGVGFYRPHIPLFAPARYFKRFANVDTQLPPFTEDDLSDLSEVARQWAIEPVTAGLHATTVKHGQWKQAVKAYLACTTFVDHQVGRLLDAVDAGQFGDNTVIVLWSDHGWHLGEKQHWGKWTGWERSTHVPLIVVPPKSLGGSFAEGGSRCRRPVSLADLYPTLTELCGVKEPDGLDGQSLVPLLRDPSHPTNRKVVTVFDRGNVTVRSEQWRYIRYADGSEELYDMNRDPYEWTNLSGQSERTEILNDFRNALPQGALNPALPDKSER